VDTVQQIRYYEAQVGPMMGNMRLWGHW